MYRVEAPPDGFNALTSLEVRADHQPVFGPHLTGLFLPTAAMKSPTENPKAGPDIRSQPCPDNGPLMLFSGRFLVGSRLRADDIAY